jgi:stage II sporulation protein AA (anti-sigma F factor antagonist)
MFIDTEEVAPGVTKVNLRGRLDAAGARAIETPFAALARTQYDMIIDLSRVTFLASLGLRVLIAGHRSLARHGGRMGCLRPDTAVEAVLISSGTDMLIPVFGDIGEAIRGVCGTGPGEDEEGGNSLTFASEIQRTDAGVVRLGAWVDELATTLTLTSRTEYALRLCLEEAVTLIVGNTDKQPDADDGAILLRLVADPTRLSITIQDRGAPIRQDQTDQTGRDAIGGGFGEGLMRQYARDVSWSRLGDSNRLTMIVPR